MSKAPSRTSYHPNTNIAQHIPSLHETQLNIATPPTIKKIALITGSPRAVRIGPAVTQFFNSVVSTALNPLSSSPETTFTVDIVDIATFKLPVFDEKVHPASVPYMAQFEHAHSIAWSAEIAKYDGYILATACYNAGATGGVKNAIDYLYNEIRTKPWMIISYGTYGGVPAAEALTMNLESMGCVVVDTKPAFFFAKTEPVVMGMSADLLSAAQGKVGEASLAGWAEKKEEILKGFGEVKELLVKV